MTPLYTIGIGVRTINSFISVLEKYHLDHLFDIRSLPRSKYKPEFDQRPLADALKKYNIHYDYWGRELGGFPQDENVLTSGFVDYTKLARNPEFQNALERLTGLLEQDWNIALCCSEGKPEECHRAKCIGVELTKWKVEVLHIEVNDGLVTQAEIIKRLVGNQLTLDGLGAPLGSRRRWSKMEDN